MAERGTGKRRRKGRIGDGKRAETRTEGKGADKGREGILREQKEKK